MSNSVKAFHCCYAANGLLIARVKSIVETRP